MSLMKDKFMIFVVGWAVVFLTLGLLGDKFWLLSLALIPIAAYELIRTEGFAWGGLVRGEGFLQAGFDASDGLFVEGEALLEIVAIAGIDGGEFGGEGFGGL